MSSTPLRMRTPARGTPEPGAEKVMSLTTSAPRYLPLPIDPFWITSVASPEAVADAPDFVTVTVHGPLPRSRVELPPIDVCAVDEHLTVRSCDWLSLFTSLTAYAGIAARPMRGTANSHFM